MQVGMVVRFMEQIKQVVALLVHLEHTGSHLEHRESVSTKNPNSININCIPSGHKHPGQIRLSAQLRHI
jgi:hypothetical protein